MTGIKDTYDIAIRGGNFLTLMDEESIIYDGLMLIKSGLIKYIGPDKDTASYKAEKVINADGKYLLPAFFNQHTHVSLSLFRGLGSDMHLYDWLQNAIWPLEKRYSNPDNVYLGAKLSIIEMIRNGTGTFADMDFHSKAVGKAASEAGIRAFLGEGLFDDPTPSAKSSNEAFDYTESMIEDFKDDELISVYITPHATFSCSPELYQKSARIAEDWGIPVCSHLSESKNEIEEIRKKYKQTPVEFLNGTGVLDGHFIAIHGVHLTDRDISILAEKKVPVIHNPHSNMVLGSGLCPVPELKNKGLRTGLGTDSAASNNHLSILREIQTAYLVQKGVNLDPSLMKVEEMLKMASRTGYEIYRMGKIGQLKEGYKADIQIIDLNGIHNQPVIEPFNTLCNSAHSSDIESLILNGKMIMENRTLLTIDEEIIIREARKLAKDIRIHFPHMFHDYQEGGRDES